MRVPNSFWEQIATASGEALRSQPADSRAVVLLSVHSEPRERMGVAGEEGLTADSKLLLGEAVRVLRPRGLLFVYGHPRELPHWGEQLFAASGET